MKMPQLHALWMLVSQARNGPFVPRTQGHDPVFARGEPDRQSHARAWTPFQRLRLAWGVFTGRYDALRWPSGQ